MTPLSSPRAPPLADSPLASSRQIILVSALDWASSTGKLQRFERESLTAEWRRVGDEVEVSLGRGGLAWGIGLHREVSTTGAAKKEGDGCAPAGIFALTGLFGAAGPESDLACSARLPYYATTRDLKAIDDPRSRYYNQLVDQRYVDEIDWQSHEEMLRDDTRYTIGAVVAHNAEPPVPGAGSCIFLHVWHSIGVPTAGCTASSLGDMTEICRWLDGAAAPLLVQLPQAEYRRLKEAWALPMQAG